MNYCDVEITAGVHGPPPLTEELGTVFFEGVAPGRDIVLPWMAAHPEVYEHHELQSGHMLKCNKH